MPDDIKPEDQKDPVSQLEHEIEAAVDAAKVVEAPSDPLSDLRLLDTRAKEAFRAGDVNAMRQLDLEAGAIYDKEAEVISQNISNLRDSGDAAGLQQWEEYQKSFDHISGDILNHIADSITALEEKLASPKTAQDIFDALMQEIARIEREVGSQAAQDAKEQAAQKLLDDLQK